MDDIKDFSELYSRHSCQIKELLIGIENNEILLDTMVCVLSGTNNSPAHPVKNGEMRGVVVRELTSKSDYSFLDGFSVTMLCESKGTCLISYDTHGMSDPVRNFWLYIFDTVFSSTETLAKGYLGLSDVTGNDILRVRAGMYIITYCLLECCLYPEDTRGLVLKLHPYSYANVVRDVLTGIAKDVKVHCGIPSIYNNVSTINKLYSHDLRQGNVVGYELKRDSFYLYK